MTQPRFFRVDGVDYTPDGIEALRSTIVVYRDEALKRNEFSLAVQLSHVIALLAYLAEVQQWLDTAVKVIPAVMGACTCGFPPRVAARYHERACPMWRDQ